MEKRSTSAWFVVGILLATGAGIVLFFGHFLEPRRVTVQHIVISFAGTRTAATRSKADAEKLAGEMLARVRNGEDFDKLMKALSDDPAGGTYDLCNLGQTAGPNEFERKMMVKGFGDLSFRLRIGEVGLVAYDPNSSPFGWHIIKRLK